MQTGSDGRPENKQKKEGVKYKTEYESYVRVGLTLRPWKWTF